jgi:dUTP pyrophosphatase
LGEGIDVTGENLINEELVEEQFRGVKEKMERIPESHPGFVYLPVYYRAGPPRIFFLQGEMRILVGKAMVFNPQGYSYDITARGYRDEGRGVYRMVYEFLPGRPFELCLEGNMMVKQLGPGGVAEEVLELIKSLGVYDLLPLLELRRLEGGGDEGSEGEVALRIKRLDPGIDLPEYAHPGDAGLDIRSAEELVIEPGERAVVGTGFAMALPEGYAAFVQPRSGLAARNGISIVNTPGLIDCHYRGEVKVILVNLGKEPFAVKKGDRIAQMVIQRVETARVEMVEELDDKVRGEGGFGSTGL